MEPRQLAAALRTLSTHLRPDVAKVLNGYADALDASGAKDLAARTVQGQCSKKPQLEALARTVELLTLVAALGEEKEEFSDVATSLAQAICVVPIKAKEKVPRPRAPPKPRPPVKSADELVAELRAVQGDRDRFPQLHAQLADSKRTPTATLHQVAHLFLANSQKYTGRKTALDDILRRHHDVLRIASQDRMLDKLE